MRRRNSTLLIDYRLFIDLRFGKYKSKLIDYNEFRILSKQFKFLQNHFFKSFEMGKKLIIAYLT